MLSKFQISKATSESYLFWHNGFNFDQWDKHCPMERKISWSLFMCERRKLALDYSSVGDEHRPVQIDPIKKGQKPKCKPVKELCLFVCKAAWEKVLILYVMQTDVPEGWVWYCQDCWVEDTPALCTSSSSPLGRAKAQDNNLKNMPIISIHISVPASLSFTELGS